MPINQYIIHINTHVCVTFTFFSFLKMLGGYPNKEKSEIQTPKGFRIFLSTYFPSSSRSVPRNGLLYNNMYAQCTINCNNLRKTFTLFWLSHNNVVPLHPEISI